MADSAEKAELKFHRPWYDFEVSSYYAVGFVTCLEWHARSRLVDLLSYAPHCFQVSDLQRLSEKVLVPATAQNVSLPALAGGLLMVTDVESYVRPINRLFEEFNCRVDAFSLLATEAEVQTVPSNGISKGNLRVELDSLFEFRHRLVHEIGMEHIGPYSSRDGWSLNAACDVGRNVVQALKIMETQISRHAPKSFPNLLDEKGVPASELHACPFSSGGDHRLSGLEPAMWF